MHKAFHPRDDINRLYVSRKEEGSQTEKLNLLIATQNNILGTNYIKVKIEKT